MNLPMVEDTVYLQPLRSHPITIKSLLQVMGIIFFLAVLTPIRAAILQRWRLVHVILTYVVSVHSWMVHVQLKKSTYKLAHRIHVAKCKDKSNDSWTNITNILRISINLQFRYPLAMPIAHVVPFDKEFSFSVVFFLVWTVRGNMIKLIFNLGWLFPAPEQDLLNTSFQRCALKL